MNHKQFSGNHENFKMKNHGFATQIHTSNVRSTRDSLQLSPKLVNSLLVKDFWSQLDQHRSIPESQCNGYNSGWKNLK